MRQCIINGIHRLEFIIVWKKCLLESTWLQSPYFSFLTNIELTINPRQSYFDHVTTANQVWPSLWAVKPSGTADQNRSIHTHWTLHSFIHSGDPGQIRTSTSLFIRIIFITISQSEHFYEDHSCWLHLAQASQLQRQFAAWWQHLIGQCKSAGSKVELEMASWHSALGVIVEKCVRKKLS